ncbi:MULTISPECIES: LysR family transcriptional regulator [Rhizobium]|uniref:HTH-type transcriptional regulator TtuA n=1 Tax=Rhizobium tropici TaxID=398 RepID=A0A6P1CC32_RHITR|nr:MULTISPECIES: LysR family transcriptional regulator [Rhizobium]AGB74061.1 transcriptional regulator, LysR family [Rhizobium tropici CIAT 899]MBB4240550.1 DNA-binding transcriptional LysR family regulator [Rhizobium tropici]MBB5592034.1 DNA-binding transcriptional LysR family regulator [Rhizobium tropici]MBB6491088.1 DNA-binding transcriptional LysR family regulator [Rhizobium tropici]NEV13105.1 LysR family transcriptional regulator [Rhizobium tropici]
MLQSIDLRTLRAFVAVAREGNVTRAAEQLNITQPAVTLQLKRLAADTGLSLFRRTSAGLKLTQEGALLAAKAEQVLATLVDFGQTAGHLATRVRGKLRIGTIIDPEFTRLGAFLKALIESGPGIETTLRHGMSGDVPEGLRRNELDAGFYLGDARDYEPSAEIAVAGAPLFHIRKLAQLTYRVVAPPSLASFVRGADWTQLSSLPWIGTPQASVHNRLLSRLFADLGVRQNIIAQVDQEMSMVAMVRTGVGLSLCRESIALHEQQAHGLVIADNVSISTTLSFICMEARVEDPIIQAALDAIGRVWV